MSTQRAAKEPRQGRLAVPRPFLGVLFRCAGAYQRVYRDRRGTCYLARCPKCGRCVRFAVGQGGTEQRFFEVSC